jgi:hypothetical protein
LAPAIDTLEAEFVLAVFGLGLILDLLQTDCAFELYLWGFIGGCEVYPLS